MTWSSIDKKWVKSADGVELDTQENSQEVKTVEEFKSTTQEHIVVQKQKHQEILQQIKTENSKKNLKKWVPNDSIFKAHNDASEVVGKVPNLLNKILNKEDLNPFDRFEIIDYKKDILTEEGKISEIELQLQAAQCYVNDPIFEEFALYLVEAEEYIKEAELTGIMNANDILNSESIYVKIKFWTDSLKFGKKNPILIKKLHFIMENFNIQEIHENSRGNNLREFKNFFIKNESEDPLYIFDRMDINTLGDQTSLRETIQDSQDQLQKTLGPWPSNLDSTPFNN